MKKFIKLINNERFDLKVISKKANADCEPMATDICWNEDLAGCATHAYDKCKNYDLAACILGADDYCEGYYDTKACVGAGAIDGNPNL